MDRCYLNEDKNLTFEFKVDGDLVVPDIASVTYTLRGSDGAIISGHENVSLPVVNSRHILKVPSAVHTSEGYRHVEVNFKFQGSAFILKTSYKVTIYVPIAATTDRVRGLLGLVSHELSDSDINLFASYRKLKTKISDMDSLLVETGEQSEFANEAIAVQTALDLMSTVPLRALMTDKGDVGTATRFSKIDFKALESRLAEQLASLVATLTGTPESAPTIFTVTNPTDPFTGS